MNYCRLSLSTRARRRQAVLFTLERWRWPIAGANPAKDGPGPNSNEDDHRVKGREHSVFRRSRHNVQTKVSPYKTNTKLYVMTIDHGARTSTTYLDSLGVHIKPPARICDLACYRCRQILQHPMTNGVDLELCDERSTPTMIIPASAARE